MTRRLDGYDALAIQRERFAQARIGDEREKMLYVDATLFLPDDCLLKVDRMSMANSLEVRVPFLDHELVECASRLPFSLKIAGLTTKRLLKRAMARTLPPAILRQRKQGFTLPIAQWLRGELKTVVERTILGERAARRGLLNPDTIRGMWQAHQQGRQDLGNRIWSVFVFELWARLYLDQKLTAKPAVGLEALV
jgi:asparagine synthase (glutamine-hydrolysing)